MDISGKTGWGISKYFGLPNRKRKLLTKEFLQDFKNELINIEMEYNNKYNRPNLDYENETYMGFYGQITETGLFYESLKRACEKHNIVKAIYKYANNMSWYDVVDDEILLEMVEQDIIKYERTEDFEPLYDIDEYEKAKYKLVEHFKGYNVIEYGTWFDDDRKGLEDIYKDGKQELIWLN